MSIHFWWIIPQWNLEAKKIMDINKIWMGSNQIKYFSKGKGWSENCACNKSEATMKLIKLWIYWVFALNLHIWASLYDNFLATTIPTFLLSPLLWIVISFQNTFCQAFRDWTHIWQRLKERGHLTVLWPTFFPHLFNIKSVTHVKHKGEQEFLSKSPAAVP